MIPRLSETTQKLLGRFYAPRGWFNKFASQDDRQDILKQIELGGDVAAIPALLHIFVNEKRELQHAAARAMHTLFQSLAPEDFADFDESIRRYSWSSWNYGQSTVLRAPKDIRSLTTFADYSNFLLGMFAGHADGYTREAAIRALDNCSTGEELPFILIRMNDWVENVRAVAAQLLEARLRGDYVPYFVQYLPLVLRLQRAGRRDHRSTVEKIQKLLSAPGALTFVEAGMSSKDVATRRFCYGVSLETRDPARYAVIARRALTDTNVRIALDALHALSQFAPSPDLKQIVDSALKINRPTVRLAALRLVLEKYPDSGQEECRRSLLDPHSGVRQLAQFYFQKGSTLDVREFYSNALSSAIAKDLPAAVAGIGETGSKSQISLVTPFLASKRPVIRVRALHAIANLDRDFPPSDFLRALEDTNNRAVRESALFLRKKVNAIGGEQIWEIHRRLSNPRHRKWTLFLLAGLSKWESVYYLIRALDDQDGLVRLLAQGHMDVWLAHFNRTFPVPREDQRERLERSINDKGHLLSVSQRQNLRALLKSVES